jgi:hypothetical protein
MKPIKEHIFMMSRYYNFLSWIPVMLTVIFAAACWESTDSIEEEGMDDVLDTDSGIKPDSESDSTAERDTGMVYAGLRYSSYGAPSGADIDYWKDAAISMAERFENSLPALVWIVGTITDGNCNLEFPNPNPGTSYRHIKFSGTDKYEDYLTAFDNAGIKVWLQVEPAEADMKDLIDIVLTRYGHHKSVIGFGVDVEWYKTASNHIGEQVTDEEAEAWVKQIRTYNPDYMLFLKHWLVEKMPYYYRDGIMFLDDSQEFSAFHMMLKEFVVWGEHFAPAPVGFQYGYAADRDWWNDFNDPPEEMGEEFLKQIPNTNHLIWVDFTANEIWPVQK